MIINNIITIIILIVYIGIVYITLNNQNQFGMILITVLTYLLISYKKQVFQPFNIGSKSIQKFTIGGQMDGDGTQEAPFIIFFNSTDDVFISQGAEQTILPGNTIKLSQTALDNNLGGITWLNTLKLIEMIDINIPQTIPSDITPGIYYYKSKNSNEIGSITISIPPGESSLQINDINIDNNTLIENIFIDSNNDTPIVRLNNSGNENLFIYLQEHEYTLNNNNPILTIPPNGSINNFKNEISTDNFDSTVRFIFVYENPTELIALNNTSQEQLTLTYGPGESPPPPSFSNLPPSIVNQIGSCTIKENASCALQGTDFEYSACDQNLCDFASEQTCITRPNSVCTDTSITSSDNCPNSVCLWDEDNSTCTTNEVQICSGLTQDDCTGNDSCEFEIINTCTTKPNIVACPSGNNVPYIECASGDGDEYPCIFTPNSISPQLNCLDFDCSNHVNDISDNPSIINCSGTTCTDTECCTKTPSITCENFNCLPFERNINASQINCIGNDCSPQECCIIPDSSNINLSNPDLSNPDLSNSTSELSSCSVNTNEIDCMKNRCYWNTNTLSCDNPNIERIKESDPIPIKGNYFVLNNNISSYDGLCINTGNKDSWRKSPDDLPLIDDKDLYIMQGFNTSLKPVISDYNSLYGPSIDGDDDSPNKLFLFSNNLSSPACCPSTFTTSTGCLCTSKKQRDFIISRGKNVPHNYNDLN